MAFSSAVLSEVQGIQAGEHLASSPYNIEAFDTFEDGIIAGRFVKYDTGSIDKLDASATPTIAGVAKRKVDQSAEQGDIYTNTGTIVDDVAEVVDFGYVAVTVTDAATPSKYAPVYTVNAATADSGKATQDATGTLLVANCVFWAEVRTGVWLVRMTAYRA